MSEKIRKLGTLAVAIAAGVFVPAVAGAQTRTKSAPPASPAVALEATARPLLDQPKQWPEAARLLVEAAEIRSVDDPRAADDLIIAAAAYRWAGKRMPARKTYVAAAERALALGDVVRAADALLCAAVIAHEQKDLPAAWELKARAERLAQSPLLTEGQRNLILGHFNQLTAERR